MTHQLKSITLAVVALMAAGAVHAQSAGSLSVRIGATQIKPHVDSGDLTSPSLAGTKADIKSDTQLGGGFTYMVTDNFAVDVPLATPFKHDIVGAGAIAGVGKIGEVRAMPFTVLGEWRFMEAKAPFRPYLSAGLTYAKFYKERSTATLTALTGGTPANPTTLKVDSKLAATIGFGGVFAINDRAFLEGVFTKTFLKTKTTLSTGQTLDAKLDPTSLSLAVGYRF